ncbi:MULTISPECIES: ABC transporter permease [Roseivirga]|uniref:ABC transporter permease n=1 Tax=Roseivirga TaxID=290180 RepID=UPI001B0107B2|nr:MULTISPECIES: ABC transporter permease [Roseivirga]MBO6659631.1 ABC transporter permease [Roseivirga sp.]MBO6761190.1 ABC transporter permease [Roseivirga sp.]MBO6907632.1 ABC transporter permease [Roseivirga sp.]WPZ10006.1 ABC transporter permease [Roseivirga spongicola]
MLKNHIFIAFRNFKKKKAFTLINVLGLTVGMTVCLLILAYAKYELSYDRYHSNAPDIYRVSVDLYSGDVLNTRDAQCYPAVGQMAVDNFPEIEAYAMARHYGRMLLKRDEIAFNEDRLYFANQSWLEVFDAPAIYGDLNSALDGPDKIVLTESAAKKYFGDSNPVGEKLGVVPGGGQVVMQVTAVIKDVPKNSHLTYDVLISWESGVKHLGWEYAEWNANNEFMYLLANQDIDNSFQHKLNATYFELTEKFEDRGDSLAVQALTDIHLYSDKSFEAEVNGDVTIVNILLIVAAFVLLVAWVNYINLSTAKSLERAKEVGVRKVLGTTRGTLVFQFLMESFIINLLALVLTFTCLQGVLPLFNSFSSLDLEINLFNDEQLLWQVALFYIIGSLASGLYPAFVLSNYKPLTVLRGKLRDSKRGSILRRGLVVFQFLITMVLLVGTLTIYLQVNHMREQKLGFDKERLVVLRAPLLPESDEVIATKFNSLRAELNSLPQVKSVAFSETMIGRGTIDLNSTTGISSIENNAGGDLNFYMYRVDSAYLSTLGIEILAGRNFSHNMDAPAFADDSNLISGIILNETGRELLGFNSNEEAVNKPIKLWGKERRVVGVIDDYNHNSLKLKVDPLFMMFDKHLTATNFISVKIAEGTEDYREVLSSIEDKFSSLYKESDFEYYFLDEAFDQQYKADQQFGTIFTTFSIITIFVAILGLFGLVLYEVQQRIKEIGIRKVLGASVSSIIGLFSISFLKLIGIAIILSIPIAFLSMQEWLSAYAYRIELNVALFAIPAIVLVLIALSTIVIQALRVAQANPVEALRDE